MKITANRDSLIAALQKIQSVVAARTTTPILSMENLSSMKLAQAGIL